LTFDDSFAATWLRSIAMLISGLKTFCVERKRRNQHKLALAWQVIGKTREEKPETVRGKHMGLSGTANATANANCSSMTSACKKTQTVVARQVHARGRQHIPPADAGGGALGECSDDCPLC